MLSLVLLPFWRLVRLGTQCLFSLHKFLHQFDQDLVLGQSSAARPVPVVKDGDLELLLQAWIGTEVDLHCWFLLFIGHFFAPRELLS